VCFESGPRVTRRPKSLKVLGKRMVKAFDLPNEGVFGVTWEEASNAKQNQPELDSLLRSINSSERQPQNR